MDHDVDYPADERGGAEGPEGGGEGHGSDEVPADEGSQTASCWRGGGGLRYVLR